MRIIFLLDSHHLWFMVVSTNHLNGTVAGTLVRHHFSGSELSQYLVGYLGRVAVGVGLALVAAGLGVILARMGLLLFGVTSWMGWLAMLLGGIGTGAGLGSVVAWLWLKGMGSFFSSFLTLTAIAAGVSGAWIAFRYGAGVEPECCASPTMGPLAYAIVGAVIFSNVVTTACGVTGQTLVRVLRRRRRLTAAGPVIRGVEETFPR